MTNSIIGVEDCTLYKESSQNHDSTNTTGSLFKYSFQLFLKFDVVWKPHVLTQDPVLVKFRINHLFYMAFIIRL